MRMPGARAQGLVVDVVVVIAVVVVIVAVKQCDVNASGFHRGSCHRHVIVAALVIVVTVV
jgi:hypothetical protein